MKLEESLLKLEEIATKLEDEETTLDQSLVLFDEGARLAEKCFELLCEGKGKLSVIKEKLDKIVEENFNE